MIQCLYRNEIGARYVQANHQGQDDGLYVGAGAIFRSFYPIFHGDEKEPTEQGRERHDFNLRWLSVCDQLQQELPIT